MKKWLALLALGLLVGADKPKDDPAVKEVEKAITVLNEAFHTRDAGKIKELMTEDHLAVTPYYGGPLDRAGQVKSLADLQLTEYSAGKMRVTMLGKDAALVTYSLTQKGKFKGKELFGKNFASAVWVRREGKWLESFYQETPLGGP